MVYCGTKHNNNYNQQNKQNLETRDYSNNTKQQSRLITKQLNVVWTPVPLYRVTYGHTMHVHITSLQKQKKNKNNL